GVAQYLIQDLNRDYSMFLGASTGSLLVNHLALGDIEKIKNIYTSVTNEDIFDSCPFLIKYKHGSQHISINHLNVVRNFIRGSKTFGESNNLRRLIERTFTKEEFSALRKLKKDGVVAVRNLSLNQVEYKSIMDFEYDEFCDWIWISGNYTPFMSLVKVDGCEYADGGLGTMVPIEEAIRRGATEVDAVILHTEITQFNRLPSRNPFSLLTTMFSFMLDRIAYQNI